MSFARALTRFHRGEITTEDLNQEVDRVLAERPEDLPDLVAEMERTASRLGLGAQTIEPLRARIAARTGRHAAAPGDDRTRLRTGQTGQRTASQTSQGPGFQSGFGEDHVLSVGDILGNRFRLEELLGTGGMSQVYLAEDLHAYGNPRVALKILSKAFSEHPDAVITLKRETAKLQQLAHPNIVNVRDFGVDGPYTYMWMEYLPGGSVYDELKKQRVVGMAPEEALGILEGICAALDYAHDHDIVHADLKPSNCMLTASDRGAGRQVKIIDFGIARRARAFDQDREVDADQTLYDPGKLNAVTLAYASPQMLAGDDVDARDDIYALGCIAYELFTGKHPFDRISAEQAMARQLKVEPNKTLSKRQLAAVRRAVAFDRGARTPSAEQFLREFQGAADGDAGVSRRYVAAGIGALLVAAAATFYVLTDPFSSSPYDPGRTFSDCPACPGMTVVASGTFTQGTRAVGEDDFVNETPARSVRIARPFAISTTEVTVAEFRSYAEGRGLTAGACLGYARGGWSTDGDPDWTDPGFEQGDSHPVTCVSWSDASGYADWLSARTGFKYRLPSASEWEYSAAAGGDAARWWDDESLDACRAANIADRSARDAYPVWITDECSDASVHTAPVGSFAANPFGLHDSLGNVFEWVLDCWNDSYQDAPQDGSAWLDGDCSQRELRGGSWFTQPVLVRHAYRNRLPANTRTSSIGFRVVRELEEGEK